MTDVKNVIQGLERTDVKASCVQRELPASDTRNNNTVSEHEAVNFDEAFSRLTAFHQRAQIIRCLSKMPNIIWNDSKGHALDSRYYVVEES